MVEAAAAADEPRAAPGRAERVFTPGLTVFLAGVAVVLVLATLQRWPRPDLHGAIDLLADGDLDGAERQRMLRRLLADAQDANGVAERWAGLLAALALADEPAFGAMLATFGPEPIPREVPAAAARERLHLGDPMLGSVLAAAVAEAAGAADEALAAWGRARDQAFLSAQPFVQRVATAALARLRTAPVGR